MHLVYGTHVAELGTLAEVPQVVALALEETRGLDPATAVALVAAARG